MAFWVDSPNPDRLAALSSRVPGTADRLTVGSDAVYIWYRRGVHGSPLHHAWLERPLKVPMTSRDGTTVSRLAALASTWIPSNPGSFGERSAEGHAHDGNDGRV